MTATVMNAKVVVAAAIAAANCASALFTLW